MPIDEMVYRATVDSLTRLLDGEINPSVTAAAKALGYDPDNLRADPKFWKLTTGGRKRKILVTKLAAYELSKSM